MCLYFRTFFRFSSHPAVNFNTIMSIREMEAYEGRWLYVVIMLSSYGKQFVVLERLTSSLPLLWSIESKIGRVSWFALPLIVFRGQFLATLQLKRRNRNYLFLPSFFVNCFCFYISPKWVLFKIKDQFSVFSTAVRAHISVLWILLFIGLNRWWGI